MELNRQKLPREKGQTGDTFRIMTIFLSEFIPLVSLHFWGGGCQRFAVLRFVRFLCGFAVSIVAYGLRFPTEIWCGFSVFGHLELRFCGFYRF